MRHHHVLTVIALGATLGQGWLFGRPDNLPMGRPAPAGIPTLSEPTPRGPDSSPCQIVESARRLRPATKPLLHAISLHLENQAATLGGEAVVIGAFEHARFFTGRSAARYVSPTGSSSSPMNTLFFRTAVMLSIDNI